MALGLEISSCVPSQHSCKAAGEWQDFPHPQAELEKEGLEAEPQGETGQHSFGFDIPVMSLARPSLYTLGHSPLGSPHVISLEPPVGSGMGEGKCLSRTLVSLPALNTESLYKYQPQQLLLSPHFSLLLPSPSSQAGRLQPLTFPWSHSLAPGRPGGCLGQK